MDEILRIIVAVLIFSALVGLYIGSYLLNKKVKKPEGAEDLTASCTGCAVTTCANNPGEGN